MKVQRRRPARLLAGALAAAMLLSVSPLLGLTSAGAADPLPPLADPMAEGAVCDGAPDTNPFTDLGAEPAGTRAVILCLVATELTSGTSETTYTPGGTVTRRQMARFIKLLADLFDELETGLADLDELPGYDADPDYSDVADEKPGFEEAIGQLTQAGIVGGFEDGTFRPNARVSRRQMAAFVNGLQEFLTGAPYTSDGDFFDDDDDDPGEDDLNALASVGIFQGNGEGQVFPGNRLTRRQMASILLRHAQVLFDDALITSPFPGDSNETLTLTPTGLASVVFESGVNASTPDDDRVYAATALPASAGGYRVTLVHTDNVFQDPDGTYRFAEDADTGLLDSGQLAARIVRVNGLNVPAQQSIGGIQPTDGTITFTVDGNGIESLVPVIAVDGGANTRLEIDDDGEPSEAFGVGGQLNYIPEEAADGSPVNGTVILLGPGYAVIDSLSDSTVFFNSDDTYQIGAGASFEEATASAFRQQLSRDDELRTCQADSPLPAPYSQGEASGYCLTDDAPESPTDLTASEGTSPSRQIQLEWTAAAPADSYNIYAYDRPCSETSVSELVGRASVPALSTSYEVGSLDPNTTYCFVVTTVESGDESEVEVGTGAADGDNTVRGTTTAT